jgi:hypothetical protein
VLILFVKLFLLEKYHSFLALLKRKNGTAKKNNIGNRREVAWEGWVLRTSSDRPLNRPRRIQASKI